MRSIKNTIKVAMFAPAVFAIVMLGGCSDDNVIGTAQVRIIHASPDAPPVNIKLDTATAISDLDYAESSGFQPVPAGQRDVVVEAIIPGGNADVINVPDFAFDTNSRNTILAVDTANNNQIEALVANESVADPGSNEVAVAVVHASTAANAVDVYVTAPATNIANESPTFTFDFKGQVDAGALPAGSYQIQVTAQDSKTVDFDSGPVDLTPFAGQKLMIAAINTTNSTSQAGSPIKLLVATDNSALTLLHTATNTGARVIHVSPDAGTAAGGPVEVWASSAALPVSPAELIDAFSYTDILPTASTYLGVPAGDYVFDVAPNTGTIGDSVYRSPSLALAQGSEYSVVAAGYVLTTPVFGLLATEDNNRSVITQASVKVIHAAPAAGVVDVYVTPAGQFSATDVENGVAGDPLVKDFTFGTITDYVPVAPNQYDIRVVAGGSVAVNREAVDLAAGSVSTVIAREPIDTGLPNDFNLIFLSN